MADLDKITANLCPEARTRKADLGLLALRLTAGGLLAGHGAQKLFGAFGGHGLEGMGKMLEPMGLQRGKPWATLAGLSEFGGGLLTALGLGGPIGPIVMQGPMATAARTVHWGKPIWTTEGGAELPTLYSVAGLAIGLAGPGRFSLDRVFGLRAPRSLVVLTAVGVAAGVMQAARKATQAQTEESAAEPAAASADGEDRVVESRPAEAVSASDQPEGQAEWTGEAAEADDATGASALASL
jgi:putative oxidoreductase